MWGNVVMLKCVATGRVVLSLPKYHEVEMRPKGEATTTI
jgi:hypothetical protein